METNYFEEQKPQIVIDEAGKSYMLETARWAKFLAVIGFVAMSIVMLGCVLMAIAIPKLGNEYGSGYAGLGIGTVLFYLIILAIFFYPMYALLKFANLIKASMADMNQQLFDEAFRYLKNTFKFWGIYTIILLLIYGIAIIFMLTIGIAASAT